MAGVSKVGQLAAVAISGEPGVGKTTTARAVARLLGAALADLDQFDPLLDVLVERLGAAGYGDAALGNQTRAARYACLVNVAVDCLTAGRPVVLVAPFTLERANANAWEVLATRLRDAGGEPTLVWVDEPPELWWERLAARAAGRDRQRLDDKQSAMAALDRHPPVVPHVRVDGRLPAEDRAAEILAAIAAG